jgi:predicted O-methyltransferase YrrM
MSGITYDYMDKYIKSLISEHDGVLKELENYANVNHVPIVQKEIAKFLELIVAIKNPSKILELGTAIAYSSILMELSSNKNCKIDTIERDESMVKIARQNIENYGFSDKINILEGECMDVLQKVDDKYDIIFIDAGKGHYGDFFLECLRLLKEDGIIIADNTLFRGMVANNGLVEKRKITIVKRMREYLEMVCDGEKYITSVIPMGDGIAVTRRRN